MQTDQIITIHGDLPAASSAVLDRARLLSRAQAPCPASVPAGEDRLAFGGFGIGAVNGIFTTGLEAHAAVRMHVTPATVGAAWSYDRKCPKRMATTSSAGRLRSP